MISSAYLLRFAPAGDGTSLSGPRGPRANGLFQGWSRVRTQWVASLATTPLMILTLFLAAPFVISSVKFTSAEGLLRLGPRFVELATIRGLPGASAEVANLTL